MKKSIILHLLVTYAIGSAGQSMPSKDTAAPATTWDLQQCLDYANSHNNELLSKAHSVNAAILDSKAALLKLAPDITIRAEVDNYWKIPVQVFPGELVGQPSGTFVPIRMGTPWMGNYGADADLPLADLQTWQNIKLARLQQQSGQSEYRALQRSLLKNVRMAYYNVQQQMEYLDVCNRLYGNYHQIHDLITLQLNKGFTDKITFNQSATLLKTRQEAVDKAQVGLEEACLDLRFWMGYPLNGRLTIAPATTLPPLEISGYNTIQLPDYEAEQLKVQVAKQQYRNAYTALYPTLHFKGSYQQLGFGDHLNFITHSPWFTVGYAGIALRLPLSAANFSNRPRNQKALWLAAATRFKHYTSEQEKKYLDEKLLLEKASRDIQRQKENIRLSEENETLSSQKISKGIIDMIQLREVQQDLYDAQTKLNEAWMDFYKHFTELNYLQNQ